jgi:hypothetical protein
MISLPSPGWAKVQVQANSKYFSKRSLNNNLANNSHSSSRSPKAEEAMRTTTRIRLIIIELPLQIMDLQINVVDTEAVEVGSSTNKGEAISRKINSNSKTMSLEASLPA